jgi:hypothetical protein
MIALCRRPVEVSTTPLSARHRNRVAVKARVVKLNPQRGAARARQFVGAKAVDAHLRYLERDGVTKDGEKGQVYSGERDVADGRAFLERGRNDRHQFRFIVSAEDGVDLADPRETTRNLIKQMEADLGTKLDWIAVDHHNTGHTQAAGKLTLLLRSHYGLLFSTVDSGLCRKKRRNSALCLGAISNHIGLTPTT